MITRKIDVKTMNLYKFIEKVGVGEVVCVNICAGSDDPPNHAHFHHFYEKINFLRFFDFFYEKINFLRFFDFFMKK